MQSNQYHGVSNKEDLNPSFIAREVRPLKYIIGEFMAEYGPFVVILYGLCIAALPFSSLPQIAEFLFFPGLILAYYSRKMKSKPIFRSATKSIDDEKGGVLFLGNDKEQNGEIWFSADDIKRHILCFGSTGSGKTRFLLGIVYQSILMGSSAMVVDGKADNTVYWLLYSICRKLKAEDNLLVLNYIIGDKDDQVRKYELKRSSNTTNPFAFGSSEQLRSLIVGLMRESSDGMWKGRASSMMAALLKALVYLRNNGVITLDVGTIRENMTLDKLVELMKNTTLSKEAISAVKAYLAELPTYTEEDAFMGEIQSKAYEQHGYLQIQLTEVMSDLSETYGHIFNVPKGEINFADVIFNRRILFVMLPSIEKDPDALAGLGKLVVSGIKSSLAVALGYDVEGTKVNVIDTKPSNAKVPFFILLDEYGFYAVEGFAVVAAQARSLGVCVGYFGQDFTSFKKASEIEASQTEANTNIKIFMKIEESKDTAEIAERRGGEASISTVSGYQNRGNAIGGLSSQDTAQIMKVKRINLRDLVRQDQGEAHVIYGDTLSRCRLFYADPMQMNLSFLNKFIMIESQKKNIVDNINKVTDRLNSMFSDGVGDTDSEQASGDKPVIMDDAVKNLVNDFSLCFSKEGSFTNAAITSIGLISVRERIKDAELEEKAGIDNNYSPKKEPVVSSAKIVADDFEDEFDEFQNSGGANDFNDSDMPSDTSEESDDEDESSMVEFNEDDFPDALAAMEDDSKPSTSIIDEAKKAASEFSDLLSGMIVANAKKYSTSPLTASEINDLNPVNRLMNIEKRFGESDDVALKNAKSDMDILSQKVVYAVSPVPEKAPVQVLEDRFLSMMKILKTT